MQAPQRFSPTGGSVQTFPSLCRFPWLCQIPTGAFFQGPLALYNWVFNDILQVSFSSFVSLNSCKLEESHGCFSLSYLSSGLGMVLRLCEVGWCVGVEKGDLYSTSESLPLSFCWLLAWWECVLGMRQKDVQLSHMTPLWLSLEGGSKRIESARIWEQKNLGLKLDCSIYYMVTLSKSLFCYCCCCFPLGKLE